MAEKFLYGIVAGTRRSASEIFFRPGTKMGRFESRRQPYPFCGWLSNQRRCAEGKS